MGRREMKHAVDHWRTQFRGEARVKDDKDVTDADIAANNLVLWGDPSSNAVLAKIADKLPIRWDADGVRVGDRTYNAGHHVPVLIYPNPLNPKRYVVLNSGFTFREYDYLNNARQVPEAARLRGRRHRHAGDVADARAGSSRRASSMRPGAFPAASRTDPMRPITASRRPARRPRRPSGPGCPRAGCNTLRRGAARSSRWDRSGSCRGRRSGCTATPHDSKSSVGMIGGRSAVTAAATPHQRDAVQLPREQVELLGVLRDLGDGHRILEQADRRVQRGQNDLVGEQDADRIGRVDFAERSRASAGPGAPSPASCSRCRPSRRWRRPR